MGRYLESWDDAQSRGSSRNGGRGGEAEVHDFSFILPSCIAEITRNHSDCDIESTLCWLLPRYCAHMPVHLLLTKLTMVSMPISILQHKRMHLTSLHVTGFIITKSPFFANTLVMQLDRRACECEISLVYLVKFQSALFSLVFLMHHLCREENGESPF